LLCFLDEGEGREEQKCRDEEKEGYEGTDVFAKRKEGTDAVKGEVDLEGGGEKKGKGE
jgi:hypothetical protein